MSEDNSEEFSYHELGENTGTFEFLKEVKDEKYTFGKYEIVVRLTRENEFIGIVSVRERKDFLTYKHKINPKGFHDVEHFYKV